MLEHDVCVVTLPTVFSSLASLAHTPAGHWVTACPLTTECNPGTVLSIAAGGACCQNPKKSIFQIRLETFTVLTLGRSP